MKHIHTITFLFLILATGCSTQPEFPQFEGKEYEGFLAFKLSKIDKLPDDLYNKLDSLEKIGELNKIEEKALGVHRAIRENNLNQFNSFFVELDSIGVMRAFTPDQVYSNIDTLTVNYLASTNQRVRLKLKAKIDNDLLLVNDIKVLGIEEGRTKWQR